MHERNQESEQAPDPVLRQKLSPGHSPSSELEPGPQPELEILHQMPRDGRQVRRPGARDRRYKEERSGSG